ncbi:MAG: hypothetical protein COA36_07470 [Desulfotalea sp.]|nr:MAG: hypothetical protein COA36_07470 [Desulfotalea sp.]
MHNQSLIIDTTIEPCPLCGGNQNNLYHRDAVRQYRQCGACHLVFVPQQFHLSIAKEKKEYDLHENDCEDEGYLRFLSRFSDPFVEKLGVKQQGLDFGCGPAPALASLIEQHGHSVALYDILYNDDKSVLAKKYDFICATEVVEHFCSPGKEFEQLFEMLLPGGWLGIMTKMVRDEASFKTWHYIRDLTHVAFYCTETFSYLAKQYGATLAFVGADVIFMQKSLSGE